MPKVLPSLKMEAIFEKLLSDKNKKTFDLAFRTKNLNSRVIEDNVNELTWKLGATESSSKPRYIIIGFQTNRDGNYRNAAIFDHCQLEKVTVKLNGTSYPHDEIINNFNSEQFETTYSLAADFRENYYALPEILNDFPLIKQQFKKFYPLFIIDTRFQPEKLKESITDITIKANFNANIPAHTKCYCLILSQRMIKMSTDGQRMIIMR